ncbi:Ipo5 [Symbiodinium sp. CCMP2456]|nr:Ipo5 [Symbiodinium sp. CCMP2456]
MEAFQHFGESVEREDLEPFVQPMMEKLGSKLQGNVKRQKKAITFIAVIAGQVDDAFAPYYGHLMPLLKQVIENTLHKTEERQLLGKCFECISLLARAVGRNGFRADAEQIMQAMIQATKVPNLPTNDPVKEYMMAASERICATMKQDFLPFVSHILPGVLERFTLAPREFTGGDEVDDNDEVNLTLMQENGQVKVMIMYSSEIQDLKAALECVHTFVEELAAAYAPFVGETAKALLPVFDFCMEDGIRDLAFETWGQLCRSARQGGQVQIVNELVMEFLKRVLPKFEAAKVDVAELKTSADGMTACLREAGSGILHAEQLRHICRTTLSALAESLKRRSEAAKGRPAQVQQDEDGEDHDDDDEEDEQALRTSMCEVAGSLMQHHADIFIAESFSDYLTLVVQWLQPGSAKEDRQLALFVICDFLEHLGDKVVAQWPQFVPKLVEDILHPDADLRQPACYGVSLAAKLQAFAPLALDAANKLSQVVTQSRQRTKKKSEKVAQACADNALSALVEILLAHPQAITSVQAQAWNVWLGGLPCQEDDVEGVRNHRRLLELLQQEKAEVVGEGGANVPKLFGILVDVYKTDMADEATSVNIGQFALRLGESKLESFAAQFSDKQKKKLLRIVREARQMLQALIPLRGETCQRAAQAVRCARSAPASANPLRRLVLRPSRRQRLLLPRDWRQAAEVPRVLGACAAGTAAVSARRKRSKPSMALIDRVMFLGTGSAVPVPGQRNMSSLAVMLNTGAAIIVDCGEGTQHHIKVSKFLKLSRVEFWNDSSFESYNPQAQQTLYQSLLQNPRPDEVDLPQSPYVISNFNKVEHGGASQRNKNSGFNRWVRIRPPYVLPGAQPFAAAVALQRSDFRFCFEARARTCQDAFRNDPWKEGRDGSQLVPFSEDHREILAGAETPRSAIKLRGAAKRAEAISCLEPSPFGGDRKRMCIRHPGISGFGLATFAGLLHGEAFPILVVGNGPDAGFLPFPVHNWYRTACSLRGPPERFAACAGRWLSEIAVTACRDFSSQVNLKTGFVRRVRQALRFEGAVPARPVIAHVAGS